MEMAQRIMGFMVSQAVYVAAKLDIARLLEDGARPVGELASACGAHEESLYRFLRMLAGHGIFEEPRDRTFANNRLSELLQEGFSDFAEFFAELVYPAWGHAFDCVRDGAPAFERVFGAPFVEYLAAHARESTRFNRFMAGGKGALAAALARLPWLNGTTIVDVGGGNGALLVELLQRRADLRGIVFDLPHVTAEAKERVRLAGIGDRCQVLDGDFFEGVPAGGGAYVLSAILHGWDDDGASRILRNVRRAIPADGRLLIAESLVAGPNEPGGKLMDLLMLVVAGGRERTESEWRTLLHESGFQLASIRARPDASPILEAWPTSHAHSGLT
jgi:SAM-dependent methyltransferase